MGEITCLPRDGLLVSVLCTVLLSDCPTKAAISSLDTVLKKFADVVFPYPTTTSAAQETQAIAQLAKSITLKTIQLPTTINSLYRTGASPGVHACEDISPFCRQFTSAFLCHRPRIRESCQNSCGVCDSVKSHDCTDMNVHDCQSLLIAGKCNQTFVKTYCPLSCSACTASPFAASCFDRADNCKELLAQGFCDLAETLMRNACRLSCGFCK